MKWNGRHGITNIINEIYDFLDHEPVILIDYPVNHCEKSAYYALAEWCIRTL